VRIFLKQWWEVKVLRGQRFEEYTGVCHAPSTVGEILVLRFDVSTPETGQSAESKGAKKTKKSRDLKKLFRVRVSRKYAKAQSNGMGRL
jgi:hypothetical protein